MKKKILSGVLLLLIVTLVTGCGVKDLVNKVSGKNKAVEAMKELTYEDDLKQANKKIGFKGKKQDDETYVWEFKDNLSITGEFSDLTDSAKFTLNYDKDDFKNKKVDLSELDEIKSESRSGTVFSVDEFKDRIGGQDGIITYVNKSGYHIVWVDKDGGYVNAYFSRYTDHLVSFSVYKAK